MRYLITTIFLTIFFCNVASAASDSEVARVKTFTGTASIKRQEKTIPAQREEKLFKGDILRTGGDGTLGIMFKDDTCLTLGHDSAVVINEFLFAQSQGKFSLVVRMVKGTASYLSGMIGKLSPQSIRFETPVATVGIRGTRFLVQIDDRGGQ
ncbi:MAG: hypothetical protein C0392_02010 [Syntrophus sp. (in: bacteria)]|nr:hypothetical protein [Syntrophus sp. (in: bacteria)]